MKDLQELFLHHLKDMYHAEKQILRSLPKMAREAQSDSLRQALETHREETQDQIERIEKVFEHMGLKPRAETCEAIQGLIEEGKQMSETAEDEIVDVGLIAAAQAIEHYEIARYGTMRTWAEQLGLNDVVDLLKQSLEEEKKTDGLLTKISLSLVAEQQEGEKVA